MKKPDNQKEFSESNETFENKIITEEKYNKINIELHSTESLNNRLNNIYLKSMDN